MTAALYGAADTHVLEGPSTNEAVTAPPRSAKHRSLCSRPGLAALT